jgi:hypothetical protein
VDFFGWEFGGNNRKAKPSPANLFIFTIQSYFSSAYPPIHSPRFSFRRPRQSAAEGESNEEAGEGKGNANKLGAMRAGGRGRRRAKVKEKRQKTYACMYAIYVMYVVVRF